MTARVLSVVRQLDGSRYAAANCGPASVAAAYHWATGGAGGSLVAAEVRDLCEGRWSGPGDATSLADAVRVWERLVQRANRRRLRLPELTRVVAGDPDGMLRAGRAAIVQVDYGVVNSERPHLSGDRRFSGLHVVVAAGVDDRHRVRVADPLYDGRRRGVPRGTMWWPVTLLVEAAAERVIRGGGPGGRATYATVRPAVTVPVPVPVPEPGPDLLRARLRQALARVEAMEARAEAAEAVRDELEALLSGVLDGLGGALEDATVALALAAGDDSVGDAGDGTGAEDQA